MFLQSVSGLKTAAWRQRLAVSFMDSLEGPFDLALDGLLEAKRARSGAVLAPEDEGATDRTLFGWVFKEGASR